MKKIAFILTVLSLIVTAAFPAQVRLPKIWVASEAIRAADLNADFRAIASGINGGLDFSNFADGVTIPVTIIENGELIASHASRHRLGGADPLTGTFTIHLQDGTCSTPTTSIGAANKGYVDAYQHPNLIAHIASNTNPHGTILYQNIIVASSSIATSAVFGTALIGTESVGLAFITSATVGVATISTLHCPAVDNMGSNLSSTSSILSDHLASDTNPHGTTLHQDILIASEAIIPRLKYQDDWSNGGFIHVATYGLDVCGTPGGEVGLILRTDTDLASETPLYFAGNPTQHRIKIGDDCQNTQITYYTGSSTNELNFGEAKLTNFTAPTLTASFVSFIDSAISSATQPIIASIGTVIPVEYLEVTGSHSASFPAYIASITVPSSFTEGYYEISVMEQTIMSADFTNAISFQASVIDGVATFDDFIIHSPAGSVRMPSPTTMQYYRFLSPGDTISVFLDYYDASPGSGSSSSFKHRIAIRFLGATKKTT